LYRFAPAEVYNPKLNPLAFGFPKLSPVADADADASPPLDDFAHESSPASSASRIARAETSPRVSDVIASRAPPTRAREDAVPVVDARSRLERVVAHRAVDAFPRLALARTRVVARATEGAIASDAMPSGGARTRARASERARVGTSGERDVTWARGWARGLFFES